MNAQAEELLLAQIESGGFISQPPLSAALVRELQSEDLVILAATPAGAKPAGLKKIRMQHHQVAQLLASGVRPAQVSAATGMCLSRISILQNDPAFKELLTHYEGQEIARAENVKDRMVMLGLDAAAELHDRILEDPEKVSTKDLVSVVTSALDRGGHAPLHRSESLSVTMSKEELDSIKRQAQADHRGTVVPKAEPNTGEEPSNGEETLPVPASPGAEVGGAESGTNPSPEAAEGLPGSGDGV